MTNRDDRQRVEGRSISMYPEDWKLVEARARELKVGVSTAVRLVVREALLPHRDRLVGRDDDGYGVDHAAPAGCDQ